MFNEKDTFKKDEGYEENKKNMVTAPIRGRARMSFFLSLHLRFVGGWGGGVGDVNVHGTCTLT